MPAAYCGGRFRPKAQSGRVRGIKGSNGRCHKVVVFGITLMSILSGGRIIMLLLIVYERNTVGGSDVQDQSWTRT